MTNMQNRKVSSRTATSDSSGATPLAGGTQVAMRLWHETPADTDGKEMHARDYETVGFVLEGTATLHFEDQSVMLEKGDSWIVPRGARHRYEVTSEFRAVEATAPPAR